jgi:flavorubredoxin
LPLLIAAPTMLFGPHPNVIYVTCITNILKPKLKFASIIGSYGWGGKTVNQIKVMLNNLKVEMIEGYRERIPYGRQFQSSG